MGFNQNSKPRDALIDRERIRGASRMIAEGTDARSVTPEQIAAVAADVEAFRRANAITAKSLATAVGYSASVISEFLAGKYAGSGQQVAIDLDAWLVEEEQRRSRPATTQFVWTNVADEIKAAANYCLDRRNVGLIYGPDSAGVGKTTALKAIYQYLGPRRCSLVTIDKVDANPTGLFKKLCSAMAIDDSGSNKNRSDRLIAKLTGRSHILLIDQVHNLRLAKNDKPLYHLMDLHDATQCAQLWCGTADMITYLERQRCRAADESLAQICSRIFPIIDLLEGVRAAGPDGNGEPLVDVDQVRKMFAKNRLRLTDDGARFLCRMINQPDSGAVRLAVKIVEYATMFCELRSQKSIDVSALQDALRRGLSTRRTDLLLAHMDVEAAKPATARAAG